jgi:phospholipid/cholesterol/gamma-HCH transport system permease protein
MASRVSAPGTRTPVPKRTAKPTPRGEPSIGYKAAHAPLGVLEQIAGMMLLTGKALIACVTPPFTWTDEFIEEAWIILKRCFVPMVFSTFAFGFGAPGLQAANFVNTFGSIDREGAFFVMASVREFAPWINGMVVAGVGGTAIAADLGARKVREEIDAMATLGLDPVRSIVAPRFLALGIMTPLLNIVAVIVGVMGGALAVILYHSTLAGFVGTFSSNFTLVDLFGTILKTSVFGFIIAICCCYKGMNVSGGPQGVGRAVNQAVVIAFAGIWVFNYMMTTTMLAAFPETGNLH